MDGLQAIQGRLVFHRLLQAIEIPRDTDLVFVDLGLVDATMPEAGLDCCRELEVPGQNDDSPLLGLFDEHGPALAKTGDIDLLLL